MSLDLTKLQRVVELADGVKRARCPACAESGSDKSGEHLRIYPDGKFGCCVHPGDAEHRRRVYALAGERGRRGIKVRVAAATSAQAVQNGILGRLVQTFSARNRPDAPDGVREVEGAEWRMENEEVSRTQRTGEANSEINAENDGLEPRTARTGQTEWTEELFNSERTLRTPQYSLVLQNKDTEGEENKTCTYKGFQGGVRCVRDRFPHLTPSGDLVIPFAAPERYHWWNGGQSVKQTLAELRERGKEVENGATF